MNDLIGNLNNYRLDKRMSQQELAKELCVAFCTVNRWFKRRNSPSMIQEHHINKLLGLGSRVPGLVRKTRTKRREKKR